MTEADPQLPSLGLWLDRHSVSAPEALRMRVQQYAGAVAGRTDIPSALGDAADAALQQVLAHPGDRSVALDLLAADALVTLALLAQAETAPAGLELFAERLLRMHLPPR
jgi:hypothetical protein